MTLGPVSGKAYSRPYLDTSVYIAAIKGPTTEDPERVKLSAHVLTEAELGRVRIIASTFLHAEVIRDRGENQPLNPAKELLVDNFLQRSFISWVELDIAGGRDARVLARRYGLKPPDAVHVAAARRGKADVLFTWDERVIVATGGDPTTGVPGSVDGLPVTTPYAFQAAQQPLDFFGGQVTPPGSSSPTLADLIASPSSDPPENLASAASAGASSEPTDDVSVGDATDSQSDSTTTLDPIDSGPDAPGPIRGSEELVAAAADAIDAVPAQDTPRSART